VDRYDLIFIFSNLKVKNPFGCKKQAKHNTAIICTRRLEKREGEQKLSNKRNENERIVKNLYEAQKSSDFEKYFSLLSEDIVYRAAGNCQISGVHKGKEKLKKIGMITFKETEGTHSVEMKSLISTETHVAVVDTWRARRKGKEIEMDNLLVYKLENRKIVEIIEYIGDEKAHDDFWK
jgi:hypothetical protein